MNTKFICRPQVPFFVVRIIFILLKGYYWPYIGFCLSNAQLYLTVYVCHKNTK